MSTADAGREIDAAEIVADAVLAIPEVADLHGGQFGEVETYLPGRRVTGVVVDENSCAVHISVHYPADVAASPNASERWWHGWSTYR